MKFTSFILIFLLAFSAAASANRVIVKWTTKADAGEFFDPNPQSKYIEHNGQACVKEVTGIKNGRQTIKVRCRQPNGEFLYIW